MKTTRKTILITGVSGFLGMELLNQLLKKDYNVIGVGRSLDYVREKYSTENVKFYHLESLDNISFKEIDTVIHCAFSRASIGLKLASSLVFLQNILDNIIKNGDNSSFINISTQGVYGMKTPPLWTEDTLPNPDYLYAMAKYSSELMCDILKEHQINYTSLRLPGITGAYDGLKLEVTSRFVKNAFKGDPICIVGGKQIFSSIDLGDVVDGIIALIENTDDNKWERVYNLGNLKPFSIIEIAETVKKVAADFFSRDVVVEIIEKDIESVNAGLNSTKFYELTSWKPKRSLEDTVRELFCFFEKEK